MSKHKKEKVKQGGGNDNLAVTVHGNLDQSKMSLIDVSTGPYATSSASPWSLTYRILRFSRLHVQ